MPYPANSTLTTGVDNYVGTVNNDTIQGVADGVAATNTFTALDSIDGGAGKDTLVLTNSAGTMSVTTSAAVKNVENLVLRSSQNAVAADVQASAAMETVTVEQVGTKAGITVDSKGNVKSVTVTGGTTVAIDDKAAAGSDKLTTVSLNGNTGAATIASDAITTLSVANTNQNATVTAAAATRALDLTLNTVTGGTIADAEATSLKVSALGGASTGVTLTAGKATKIDFVGDKSVSVALGAQAAGLAITSTNAAGTTITSALNNDVAFTGGDGKDVVTVGATTKAITMGKGDDTVTVNAAAVGAGGSVTGGEGTDTLSLSAADAYTASAATTFANAVKGFEVLQIGATAGAGEIKVNNLNNASNNAITKVVANGAVGHAVTISGLTSGNTIEFKAGNTAATTATVTNAATGTADVLNVGISNNAGINVNTVNAADIETVNFLTDDTATVPTAIAHTAALSAAAAKSITVAGDAGLALTFTGTALTSFDASGVTKGAVSLTTGALANAATLKGGAGNDTIDASAATKAVTLEGGAGNDTLTGSSAETNTINGGDGNDTIVGGAKADTINAGAGNDTITSGKGLDIIDFGTGDDTFVLTANDNGNIYASISNAGKGDKIDFLAGGGAATFTAAKISLAETAAFADYLQAAAAGGADRVVWFQFGGNTFAVQDVSAGATFTNGADQVVKLVGLVDLSTATIDGAATNVLTLG
ncbi:calcium-binding protein [Rhizobium rosettiformans W3]|uniref:Calcium-binding protein n=1 Tax=Rhizobium rosettiformans W3 TaxID=538378 RepID=A0A4S8PIR1_9HYPH|nr:calcium-binding protein [Rhizobium rosettiformans W3]